MLRKFLNDTLTYGASTIASRLLAVLSVMVLGRLLSQQEYGLVDLSNAFVMLANLLVGLEVTQGLGRQYGEREPRLPIATYASTAMLFNVGMAALLAVVLVAAPGAAGRLVFGVVGQAAVVRLTALVTLTQVLCYAVFNQTRWEMLPRLTALGQLSQPLITVPLAIAAVAWLAWGVAGVLAAQAAGAVAAALLGLWGLRGRIDFSFSRRALAEMLRFSLPLLPSSAAIFVITYIDRYCLNWFGGLAFVGVYGIGVRFGSLIQLVVQGAQMAFIPVLMRQHESEAAPRDIARAFRYFCFAALVATLGIGLFANELVLLLVGQRFLASAPLVPWLALGSLLAQSYFFAPGPALKRRTTVYVYVNVAAAALNLGLNLVLIPRLGPLGSALTVPITSMLSFAALMAVSQSLYPVPHQWGRLAAALAITVVSFGCVELVFPVSGHVVWTTIITKLILMLLVVAALAGCLIGRWDLALPRRLRSAA